MNHDRFLLGDLVADCYRIEARLRTGEMGTVYQAVDLNAACLVAISVLPANHLGDDRARLEREAKALSGFQHPNRVKVHFAGDEAGCLLAVHELVSGPTVRQVLDLHDHGLEIGRAIELARQLAGVLAAAHAHGLVHRNLKPENLFLPRKIREPEHLILCDLGIAIIEQVHGLAGLTPVEHTTSRYDSPEQAGGEPIGPPSDVYSFGCILFELVTGKPPFASVRVKDLSHAHRFLPPPSARAQRLSLSAELDELIAAMLAKEPAQRPAVADVARVLATTGSLSTSTPTSS